MDVWAALAENPIFNETVTPDPAAGIQPLSKIEPVEAIGEAERKAFAFLTIPLEEFGCDGCGSYYKGWCRAVPGKPHYNIRMIGSCANRRVNVK